MPSDWDEGRSDSALGGLRFGEAVLELSGSECAAALAAKVAPEHCGCDRLC